MLTITKIVIHELVKEVRVNDASTYISNDLLEVTPNVQSLVERLNESYAKDNITYAVFSETEGKVFPLEFGQFVGGDRTAATFLNFTRIVMNNLRDQIRNVTLAKGGFFIFAEYETMGVPYVAVYLVRDAEGMLFKRSDQTHSFEVDTIKYMNTDKLAMGCRINHTRYSAVDGNYLSLIKNKQLDISEYFYNWISIHQAESSAEFTNTLYDIVNNIDLPLNQETNLELTVDEFRSRVVSYIDSQPAKTVSLNQMGLHFYQDDQKFIQYAINNNLVIDHEFRANKRALKKFISVIVNADGINLRFTRGEFLRKVKLSTQNPNQVLIESERFANALRAEIET